MSFEGRSAVVTGAGGGMGLNIARDLLAAGANVTGADLKDRHSGLDAGLDAVKCITGYGMTEEFEVFQTHCVRSA